jgi:hypothetical protein
MVPDEIQIVSNAADLPMGFLMRQALGFLLERPWVGEAVEFFGGEIRIVHRRGSGVFTSLWSCGDRRRFTFSPLCRPADLRRSGRRGRVGR